MSEKIRVLLVDDHTLFRSGIKSLLQRNEDFEVVGEAGDGLEGIKRARSLAPDGQAPAGLHEAARGQHPGVVAAAVPAPCSTTTRMSWRFCKASKYSRSASVSPRLSAFRRSGLSRVMRSTRSAGRSKERLL